MALIYENIDKNGRLKNKLFNIRLEIVYNKKGWIRVIDQNYILMNFAKLWKATALAATLIIPVATYSFK